MNPVEFSRPKRLDQIGAGSTPVEIEADAGERAALAVRFNLFAIDRLTASLSLSRDGAVVSVTGRVIGAVVQRCVATDEPVPAAIDETVDLRFMPEPDQTADEMEIDADAADTIFYTGSAIDLGEVAAETLALALDPYPRAPEAERILREAGVVGEDEVVTGPFGALAGLKDKLAGKD